MRTLNIFTFLWASIVLALPAHSSPDPRATELDWASKEIKVTEDGMNTVITLQTSGQAGRRIIQTSMSAYTDQTFATLTYQVVLNFDESYRSMQRFPVAWHIPTEEYKKIRTTRKIYILERDPITLGSAAVREIKEIWKVK